MKLFAAYIFLVIGAAWAAQNPAEPQQEAVMVFDAPCITEVAKTVRTQITVPLGKDGQPQPDKATVSGLRLVLNPSCARIEVRRTK